MLADEQAALRRLATAVARDVAPAEIFTAVVEEIGRLIGADDAAVVRFEPDRAATVVAGAGPWTHLLGDEMRFELDDSLATTTVFRTGRSARVDDHDYSMASGPIGDYLRRVPEPAQPSPARSSFRAVSGGPSSRRPSATRLPADTEERMANFTELVGIVIANAEGRAELTASRARVLAAGDEARRHIERDLHDGAQARLAAPVLALKLARRELGDATGPAVELMDEALALAEAASTELRELAHGSCRGAQPRRAGRRDRRARRRASACR